MAIVNGYVTLPELKAHLNLQTSEVDTKLENVATSVSRWIDLFCERHFFQDGTVEDPVARWFDAHGSTVVRLGTFNDLASVSELATDTNGDGAFDTVWDPSEFRLLPRDSETPEPRPFLQVKALGPQRFPDPGGEGEERVRISGVWGWPQVPATVHEACLIQAARIYKRRDAPEGVMGFDQFGMIRVSGRPDPDVQQQLNPYRHPAAAKIA